MTLESTYIVYFRITLQQSIPAMTSSLKITRRQGCRKGGRRGASAPPAFY